MAKLLKGHLNEDEQRMLEFIAERYASVAGPNAVASAIFSAVQNITDGLAGEVVVDSYLLHNLAACAWVALLYDRGQGIPWDQGNHDYILIRTLRGIMLTLGNAIREGRVREVKGNFYFHDFLIPNWFVEKIKPSIPV